MICLLGKYANYIPTILIGKSIEKVYMRQSHLKRDADGRLRNAAASACRKRGANAGTVIDVIETLHEHDLLESSLTRQNFRKASRRRRQHWKDKCCSVITLPCESGIDFSWCTLTPHAALQFFVDNDSYFVNLLTWRREGEPLQLLFYHDEIVPGNPLHPDNARRSVAFYISFLQWAPVLYSELTWLPIAVLRMQVIKTVCGGLSECIAKLFQSWQKSFAGEGITLADGSMLFFPIRLTGCIMDESAMHAMWSVKGASGRRPCMKCKNCVSKVVGSSLSLNGSNYFRDICCVDIDEFEALRDHDAWEAVDHLAKQQPLLNKKTLAELQTNMGFTHSPTSVLAQRDLRNVILPSTATFDLLHCFWNAGGIAPVEVALFVDSLRADGLTWEEIQAAVTVNVSSSHPSSIPSRKRWLTEPYFGGHIGWKASGSQHMMMLPLLHLWLMLHIHGTERWERLSSQCESFRLLCERLYALVALIYSGNAMFRDCLKSKQKQHYNQFLIAYGRDKARPKHHYSLHAADQWSKFKCCLDTKTQERKHQLLKREVESSGQNLEAFEERILSQLLQNQVLELEKQSNNIGKISLVEPKEISERRWRSVSLKHNLMTWNAHDVIIHNELAWAGRIQCFEQRENNIKILVEPYNSSRIIGFGLVEWQRDGQGLRELEWQDSSIYKPMHWLLTDASLLTIW